LTDRPAPQTSCFVRLVVRSARRGPPATRVGETPREGVSCLLRIGSLKGHGRPVRRFGGTDAPRPHHPVLARWHGRRARGGESGCVLAVRTRPGLVKLLDPVPSRGRMPKAAGRVVRGGVASRGGFAWRSGCDATRRHPRSEAVARRVGDADRRRCPRPISVRCPNSDRRRIASGAGQRSGVATLGYRDPASVSLTSGHEENEQGREAKEMTEPREASSAIACGVVPRMGPSAWDSRGKDSRLCLIVPRERHSHGMTATRPRGIRLMLLAQAPPSFDPPEPPPTRLSKRPWRRRLFQFCSGEPLPTPRRLPPIFPLGRTSSKRRNNYVPHLT
jgi:hypothetical protein